MFIFHAVEDNKKISLLNQRLNKSHKNFYQHQNVLTKVKKSSKITLYYC